jgi:hypothetical protein
MLRLRPALATNDKQSARIAFTFCDNSGEAAGSLDRANQPADLEMRGERPSIGQSGKR